MKQVLRFALPLLLICFFVSSCAPHHSYSKSQSASGEKSVNPGINKHFENPDIEKYVKRFEREDRPVYRERRKIVETLGLKKGMHAADIGAGTGFISLLLAEEVGPEGRVYALDIAKNFVEYTVKKAEEKGFSHLIGRVNSATETGLPKDSVDAVIIVDTYHHFEYPTQMLASIREALKDRGTLTIVDFERIEGETKKWILDMVRAGKGTFTDEIINAGFSLSREIPFTDDHYILKFKKRLMPGDSLRSGAVSGEN